MRTLRIALISSLFLVACSSLPEDGEACEAAYCSNHGACTFEGTRPTCACAAGYTGVICSRCAEGFHRDDAQACVKDEACTPGLCGDHGTCAVQLGKATCACEPGYGGLDCKACRAGFHAEEGGTCVLDAQCFPSTCSGGGACAVTDGRVACTCEAGRSGTFCETRAATCDGVSCGDHGTCAVRDGEARCLCKPGYSGPTCASCYPGYREGEGGTCVFADSCTPSTCSYAGTCAVASGVATCTCSEGYAGAVCDTCAEGFHRGAGWACVKDETCATADRCGDHGECREADGRVACACHEGWAGAACDTCAPGFHRDAELGCALDTECRPETCRFHGACTEVGGVATCECAPGYEGDHCETNVDDCVNTACGTGACVDLVGANACLCADHTWGASCP